MVDPSSSLGDTEADLLEATIEFVTTKLEVIEGIHEKILDKLLGTEDYGTVFEESDDYVIRINEDIKCFKGFLKRNRPQTNVDTSLNVASGAAVSTTSLTSHKPKTVNLPKLQLITFEGDILRWKSFIDSFEAAIDKNSALENIQKFQYLRAQLKGEAALVIEGLPLTSDNYTNAMEILKERYGQQHKLRNAYMTALWSLPSPTETISSLQTFHDNVETYVRGLQAIGRPESTYGELLIPIITEKLPEELLRNISRDHGSDNWTLKELREAIRKEISAMRAGKRGDISCVSQSNSSVHDYSDFSAPRTASAQALLTNASDAKSQPRRPCVFCKGNHRALDCQRVKDHNTRLDIVKKERLCWNCFSSKHISRHCESHFKFRMCSGKHHTTLHHATLFANPPTPSKFADKPATNAKPANQVHTNTVATPDGAQTLNSILLKTACANIKSNLSSTRTNILFDEGSTKSFVTSELADQLQLKPDGEITVNIATFGSEPTTQKVKYAAVNVETTSGSHIKVNALIVPTICAPLNNCVTADVLNLPHIRGLRLAQPITVQNSLSISVLIGADFYWQFVGNHVLKGDGPTAVSSALGYLLSGPTSRDTATFPMEVRSFQVMVTSPTLESANTDPLTKLWDLESIGIRPSEQTCEASDDFETFCAENIEKREKQYFSRLPWKPDHLHLPTNFNVANARTRNLARHLPHDTIKIYDRIMNEQEQRGFIERVLNDDNRLGHYLPHRCVKKDSPTTPICIVYDCSCKSATTPSLNDCLQKGPELLNDLAGIIMRFRLYPIALSSDIEKAFLHVGLHEQDRDFTKFLWLSNPEEPDSDFIVYRFSSVLFGSNASPAILNAVIRKHLKENDSESARDISTNIYVDNVISGVENEQNALDYFNSANQLVESGGFHLRSWATNSQLLKETAKNEGVLDDSSNASLLGLK
ncbi:uncharacterized protein LOC135495093 [Lineus longissimus]|uniref:uncharacterized protein LOC135495093 n=1 Tax=Lineus longissimus TaxID=88925 RepID=UPI00315CE6F5